MPCAAALGVLVTATLVALPLGAAPAQATSAATEETEKSLVITDFAFEQRTVRVNVGDTVTWVNKGKAVHLAKSRKAPARFASPRLAAGASWSHTFRKPGTYPYRCALHPTMTATVVALAPREKKVAEDTVVAAPPVVAAASSTPLRSQNSAPLLLGSTVFVIALALISKARRRTG